MMPSLMIDHLSINLRSGTDNLVSEISFAIKEGESLILLLRLSRRLCYEICIHRGICTLYLRLD